MTAALRSDSVRQQIAINASISRRLDLCSLDESRVVDYVLSRLELGRERYGELDLSRDRDWREEERQEHADAVVYRACAEIQRLDRVHADLRHAAGIEMVEHGLVELRDAEAWDGVWAQFSAIVVAHPRTCPCGTCAENRMAAQVEDEVTG